MADPVSWQGPADPQVGAPDLETRFAPGSELGRAFEGVSSALRAETARLMAAQTKAAERQAAELMDKSRREAAAIIEQATNLREAARVAVEQAAARYEGVLRVIGQLSGGLAQIREQAAAEYEALQRQTREAGPTEPRPSAFGGDAGNGSSW
jgi:hypothetical protein